jgi:hypothetical protein
MPRPANPPAPPRASELTVTHFAPLSQLVQTQILLSACRSHPSVYASVVLALEARLLEDGKTDLSFDHLAKQVGKDLNPSSQSTTWAARHTVKPAGQRKKFTLSSRDEPAPTPPEEAEDLTPLERTILLNSLRAHLKAITEKTNAYSSWQTKLSALDTLLKIGTSLCETQTPSATAARTCDFPDDLLASLKHVLKQMSEEERREWVEDEVREEMAGLVAVWHKVGLQGLRALKEMHCKIERHGEDKDEEETDEDPDVRERAIAEGPKENAKKKNRAEVIALDSSDVEDAAKETGQSNKKHRIS